MTPPHHTAQFIPPHVFTMHPVSSHHDLGLITKYRLAVLTITANLHSGEVSALPDFKFLFFHDYRRLYTEHQFVVN
jgi:hypothetical protein